MNNTIYACPDCGGKNVQLRFPVWVDANDIDNKKEYELDGEASPEEDSDKGFCTDCGDTKLLEKREEDLGIIVVLQDGGHMDTLFGADVPKGVKVTLRNFEDDPDVILDESVNK
jgi:hypothetical protein